MAAAIRLVRSFRAVLCMVFTGGGLWLAAGAVFVLLLFAPAAFTSTGAAVPALQAMICCALGQDGTQTEYIMPDALQLTSSASSQYLDTFLPVIAAFPAVPLLLDAQKSGYSRFCLLRAGRAPWLCGQLLAGWFAGGAALALGYLAMALPTLMLLPWQDITPAQLLVSSPFAALAPFLGAGAVVLARMVDLFLYGSFFSLPALVLVRRLRNNYLALCLPLLVRFLYDTLLTRFYRQALQDGAQSAAIQAADWFSANLAAAAAHPALPVWLWLLGGLGAALFFHCFLAEGEVDIGA